MPANAAFDKLLRCMLASPWTDELGGAHREHVQTRNLGQSADCATGSKGAEHGYTRAERAARGACTPLGKPTARPGAGTIRGHLPGEGHTRLLARRAVCCAAAQQSTRFERQESSWQNSSAGHVLTCCSRTGAINPSRILSRTRAVASDSPARLKLGAPRT